MTALHNVRRVALAGLVIGASACGSVPTDDTSLSSDAGAVSGAINFADVPSAPAGVDPAHVTSCVENALFQSFVGNEFWQGIWDGTGQDEQVLAEFCTSIGRDDPAALAQLHDEWMSMEAGAVDAASSEPVAIAPVVPPPPPPPTADATPSIQVTTHFVAGNDNENKNGEWVRFTNAGAGSVDLAGWRVSDEGEKHSYRFAPLDLAPGASVTLFTGCGSDTGAERYWCNSGSAVWNNDGDVMSLFDASGNLVAQQSE